MMSMSSIEAQATHDSWYYYCCRYCCSYLMCTGPHGQQQIGLLFPAVSLHSQHLQCWGNWTQLLKPAKAARSPDMESGERREQMAFALCAGGFLFPNA